MSSSEGYNLCIIGTGKVGGEIADRIYRSSLNIENIFLFNKSLGKAESLKRVLERDKSNKSIHTIRNSAELEKILGDIDISILSIGEYHQNRMDELGSVLPGLVELAEVYGQANYRGNSIIITNPVDIVSYIWALYSGLPHQTIVGLGLLDTIRARDIIAEEITSRLGKYCEGVELGSEDINAFCIGPHSEKATPYILGIRGFKLKEKEAPWQIIFGESEEHYEQLRRAIDQRAKDTYTALGGTHKEVAQATEELLASLTQNSGELLSGSVFFRLRDHPDYKSDPEYADYVSRRDRGVFIGTVIKFENRLAVPQQIKLEGIVKKMFAEAYMELEDVLDNLRQGTLKDLKGNPMMIKGGYVKDSKAPRLEVKAVKAPIRTKEAEETEFQIYVATEKEVFVFNRDLDETMRPFLFPHSLRSVFVEGEFVYAGWREGVFRKSSDGSLEEEYKIDKLVNPEKYGVNSIAVVDGVVYATHSAAGVFAWESGQKNAKKLFERQTTGKTRGIKQVGDSLFFSSGNTIYMVQGGKVVNTYKCEAEVACFDVDNSYVYASYDYEKGVLGVFDIENPKKVRKVSLKDTIIYLDVIENGRIVIAGLDSLVYASEPFSRIDTLDGWTKSGKVLPVIKGSPGYVVGAYGKNLRVWDLKEKGPAGTRNLRGEIMDVCVR